LEGTSKDILEQRIDETRRAYQIINYDAEQDGFIADPSSWEELKHPIYDKYPGTVTYYLHAGMIHVFLVNEPETVTPDNEWRVAYNSQVIQFIQLQLQMVSVRKDQFNIIASFERFVPKILKSYTLDFEESVMKCVLTTDNKIFPQVQREKVGTAIIGTTKQARILGLVKGNGFFREPFSLRMVEFIDNRPFTRLNGIIKYEGENKIKFIVEAPGLMGLDKRYMGIKRFRSGNEQTVVVSMWKQPLLDPTLQNLERYDYVVKFTSPNLVSTAPDETELIKSCTYIDGLLFFWLDRVKLEEE